jgi:hypothetical protein
MENKYMISEDQDLYLFQCPHCECFGHIKKNEVNCTIFRHAAYFNTHKTPEGKEIINITDQINPHTPKEICEQLVAEGKVVGCGKPLQFIFKSEGNYVKICDYI